MKNKVIYPTIFFLIFMNGCSASKKKNISNTKKYNPNNMTSLVEPPRQIPLILKPLLKIADSKAGKKVIPGRVLAWSPKIAISSGLLELYVEDQATENLNPRLVKLLRMIISYTVPSQFAIDINSQNYHDFKITKKEIKALQGKIKIESVETFSKQEKTALRYAFQLSKTPIKLNPKLLNSLLNLFSEKEIVTIASLTAKVNYWARLLEALKIKPAGYTNDKDLNIKDYNTSFK